MSNPIISKNGTKYWYKNGKKHREDGPAVIYAGGGKSWYKNGELHREDGPAIIYADDYKVWYKNGIKITKEEIRAILSNPNSTPEELAPFKVLIESNLNVEIEP